MMIMMMRLMKTMMMRRRVSVMKNVNVNQNLIVRDLTPTKMSHI